MIRCFVGLGANLADPERQLALAVSTLVGFPEIRLTAVSPVYRSAPLGPPGQPDYLNAVAELETTLAPLELLDVLQAAETRQGRQRGERWGPRTIDLDILLYGDQRIELPRLQVPHPQLARRNFVLQPLCDLCGSDYVLPDGVVLGTLVARCEGGELTRTAITLDPDRAIAENLT